MTRNNKSKKKSKAKQNQVAPNSNSDNASSVNDKDNSSIKGESSLSTKEDTKYAQSVSSASKFKTEGNEYFAQHDYARAATSYRIGLAVLQQSTSQNQSEIQQENQFINDDESYGMALALQSNLAMTLLKMQQFVECWKICHQALLPLISLDHNKNKPQNGNTCHGFIQNQQHHSQFAKLWYRRALAREHLQDYLGAKQDLEECLHHLQPLLQNGTKINGNQPHPPSTLSTAMSMKQVVEKAFARITTCLPPIRQQSEENIQLNHQNATNQEHEKEIKNENQTDHSPKLPSAQRQRQVVLELLVGRQISIQHQKSPAFTASSSHPPALPDEAFFLLEWAWWSQWCQAVNFYALQRSNDSQQSPSIGPRQMDLLKLFPPGTAIPIIDDDDDDEEGDEDDEEANNGQDPQEKTNSDQTTNQSSKQDEQQQQQVDLSPIDNSSLLLSFSIPFIKQWWYCNRPTNSPLLKSNLVRGHHYEVIPREVYHALRSWYGEVTQPICRRAQQLPSVNNVVLRLYHQHEPAAAQPEQPRKRCHACLALDVKKSCRQCSQAHYCDRDCQESHWKYHKAFCLKEKKKRQQCNLKNGTHTPSLQLDHYRLHSTVGLHNLGNTCFMNSALQCLSHTTPLTRHFLSKKYLKDINPHNPLGAGGKLAMAYNTVLRDLWMQSSQGNGSSSPLAVVSPTGLKRAISLFCPRFAGHLQHDAQEFLAFFLDGLHEDLNRIRKAPYVEMPDVQEDGNMAIAGAEAWDANQRRNDSLVVDTFYGQFKSTCICPHCQRISVSFDSFNHVSLEIPQLAKQQEERLTAEAISKQPRFLQVVVMPIIPQTQLDDEKQVEKDNENENENVDADTLREQLQQPTRYMVEVTRGSTVEDLRLALSTLCGISAKLLTLCVVDEHRICEILQDNIQVNSITASELLVAYTGSTVHNPSKIHVVANHGYYQRPVVTPTTNGVNETNKNGQDQGNGVDKEIDSPEQKETEDEDDDDANIYLFGVPFLASIHPCMTRRQVWNHLTAVIDSHFRVTKENSKQGEDDDEAAPSCPKLKSIQFRDTQFRPRPVFPNDAFAITAPNDKDDDEETGVMEDYLGQDCRDRYLFLTLEWELQKKMTTTTSSSQDNGDKRPQQEQPIETPTLIPQFPELNLVNHSTFAATLAKSVQQANSHTQNKNNGANQRSGKNITLDQCFETFTKPERLDEHNKWYCNKCKKHVRALKTMELWRLPNVMVVHLKRFEFQQSFLRRDNKLDTHVYCPLDNFDMTRHWSAAQQQTGQQQTMFVQDDGAPATYDLFAVINHYGRLGFGHYTAFARSWDEESMSDEWFKYDDASVQPLPPNHPIVSPAAYVLFYRRRQFS